MASWSTVSWSPANTSLPRLAEAADGVELGGMGVVRQEAEQAPWADRSQLAGIAHQRHLRPRLHGLTDQAGHIGGRRHARLIDEDDLTSGEAVGRVDVAGDRVSRHAGLLVEDPGGRRRHGQAADRVASLGEGGGGGQGPALAGAGRTDQAHHLLAARAQADHRPGLIGPQPGRLGVHPGLAGGDHSDAGGPLAVSIRRRAGCRRWRFGRAGRDRVRRDRARLSDGGRLVRRCP